MDNQKRISRTGPIKDIIGRYKLLLHHYKTSLFKDELETPSPTGDATQESE
jgi:hypothetical protein